MPRRASGRRGFLIESVVTLLTVAAAASPGNAADPAPDDVAEQRLDLMRRRVQSIAFRSDAEGFPRKVEAEPLFRYDDLTRGYLDGTVWRLGAEGRPKAIVTAELCRDYYGSGPKVVYDLLSLSEVPFKATSSDIPGWSPTASALAMQELAGGPAPAKSETTRLFQMRQIAARFTASQEVDGEPLRLRLLPRQIERYAPSKADRADGAVFLFVSGRMPGVLLLIETDGEDWQYGVGRLSGPSKLSVSLDDAVVWTRPRAAYLWDKPYTATNATATIPGLVEVP